MGNFFFTAGSLLAEDLGGLVSQYRLFVSRKDMIYETFFANSKHLILLAKIYNPEPNYASHPRISQLTPSPFDSYQAGNSHKANAHTHPRKSKTTVNFCC